LDRSLENELRRHRIPPSRNPRAKLKIRVKPNDYADLYRILAAPRASPMPLVIERRKVPMITKRTFSAALLAGAATSLISTRGMTAGDVMRPKARNIVFAHGLFADGTCWTARTVPRSW
jgi:hypothetical protein